MFKLSELPVGTTIETPLAHWDKVNDGVWMDPNAHCGDCGEVIFEGGPTEEQRKEYEMHVWTFHNEPAEELIKDFEIKTMPFAVVEHLVKAVFGYEEHEWHVDESRKEEILKDAIDSMQDEK